MLNDDGVSDLIILADKDQPANEQAEDKELHCKGALLDEQVCVENETQIVHDHTNLEHQTTVDEQENENKVFGANDIQTLMNNQLFHKSQLDHNLDHSKLEQQQHLILVTQNGDKIILIQNPSVSDNQSTLQLNAGPLTTTTLNHFQTQPSVTSQANDTAIQSNHNTIEQPPTVTANRNKQQFSTNSSTGDAQREMVINHSHTSNVHNVNNEKQECKVDGELSRIQLQHKTRQQSLLLQLEHLKKRHNLRLEVDDSTTGSKSTMDDENFWEFDESNEFERQRTHKLSMSRQSTKKKGIPIEKFCCDAKWYPLFCSNLEKANNYVRRRLEHVEQLSKYFPTGSFAFESRCGELKKHLKKLELNLERFQNVLGKEIHLVENKLKNFFQDYHLEQFQAEIEEEDRKDLEQVSHHYKFMNNFNSIHQPTAYQSSPVFDTLRNHQSSSVIARNCKNNRNRNFASEQLTPFRLELITPASISITPSAEARDEIDPVPEIRDVQDCDISLEEMDNRKYYSNNYINKPAIPRSSPVVQISIKACHTNTRKSVYEDADSRTLKHQKKA